MYNLSKKIYQHIADQLQEEITSDSYIHLNVELFDNQYQIFFSSSLFPTLSTVDYPEGETTVITDITPVWWSVRTLINDVELINDFDFNTLKEVLCHR